MYTYPFPVQEGTLSAADVHRLLSNDALIAKRIGQLSSQRFIADQLLVGRFEAVNGGVAYPNGDPIFADRDPEAVAPAGEYPVTPVSVDSWEVAKVKKWGEDGLVTDEAITNLGQQPLDKTLKAIVNSIVRVVDSVAMGVIGSRVTAEYDSSSLAWTTGEALVESLLTAKAIGDSQGDGGYSMDTVALTPLQYAKVAAYLTTSGILPREGGNPIVNGSAVNGSISALGLTFLQSPHVVTPMLVDREALGGMADQKLHAPGYSRVDGVGIEAKVIREEKTDAYRPRARRVTVPVVTDPYAAIKITGTGI